jgi:hypothetical protein
MIHRNTQLTSLAIILIATVGGCTVGEKLDKLHVANKASGNPVAVRLLHEKSVSGELLALDDLHLYILYHDDDQKIGMVPYNAIRTINLGPGGPSPRRIDIRGIPTNKQREHLTLISRYPQGVNEELLHNLLNIYNQNEVIVIE